MRLGEIRAKVWVGDLTFLQPQKMPVNAENSTHSLLKAFIENQAVNGEELIRINTVLIKIRNLSMTKYLYTNLVYLSQQYFQELKRMVVFAKC